MRSLSLCGVRVPNPAQVIFTSIDSSHQPPKNNRKGYSDCPAHGTLVVQLKVLWLSSSHSDWHGLQYRCPPTTTQPIYREEGGYRPSRGSRASLSPCMHCEDKAMDCIGSRRLWMRRGYIAQGRTNPCVSRPPHMSGTPSHDLTAPPEKAILHNTTLFTPTWQRLQWCGSST